MNCWQDLGIEATADKRAIKRAYAVLLKGSRPDDNAGAYQSLREAYEQALILADYIEQQQLQEDDEQFEAWREQQDREYDAIDEDNSAIRDEVVIDVFSSSEDFDDVDALVVDKVEVEQQQFIEQQQVTEQQQVEEEIISFSQWEAGLKLIYQQLQNKNQTEAIDVLDYIQRREFLESLDDQYEFEGGLLICIYQQEYFPFEFILKVLEFYDWKQSENPFAYDYPYNYAYNAINNQLLIEINRRDIVKNYHKGRRCAENVIVEDILFSPFDEEAMEEVYGSRVKLKIANKIFNYAHKHYNISDSNAIPRDTMQWWLQWVKDSSSNQDRSTQKKIRGLFVGWLFVFVFLLVQGIIAVNDGNKRRLSQKNHNRNYSLVSDEIKYNGKKDNKINSELFEKGMPVNSYQLPE